MEWISVALRARHPAWHPDRITSMLGLKPRIAWQAGDARRTPDGQPLPGNYPETYWCSEKLDGFSSNSVESLLQYVKGLEKLRPALEDFLQTGGRIEFSVGWGLTAPSGGEHFPSQLLGNLGHLGIDLSLSIYQQVLDETEQST